MTLCSDGHDEVCFEVEYCPVCRLMCQLAEKEALEDAADFKRRVNDEIEDFGGFD